MSTTTSASSFLYSAFLSSQSLVRQCFQASPSDSVRDEYEKLAEQKSKLKRKLKELEAKGQKNSGKWEILKQQLNDIESKLQ